MAYQMSYNDPGTKLSATASFWLPVSLCVDMMRQVAVVTWVGWVDQAHQTAGGNPLFTHHYEVSGAGYNTYVLPVLTGTYPGGASQAFHDQAMAALDNGGKSFFDGATKL